MVFILFFGMLDILRPMWSMNFFRALSRAVTPERADDRSQRYEKGYNDAFRSYYSASNVYIVFADYRNIQVSIKTTRTECWMTHIAILA